MAESKPIGLDDDIDERPEPQQRDKAGRPYCRVHHCSMKSYAGGPKGSKKTYYKCPVPKCSETGVRVKTPPAEPLMCPVCAKADDDQYCEKDRRLSRDGRIVLRCPVCGWRSADLADPRLADLALAMRRSDSQYGAR